jgi:hypothetical protein
MVDQQVHLAEVIVEVPATQHQPKLFATALPDATHCIINPAHQRPTFVETLELADMTGVGFVLAHHLHQDAP